MDFFYALKPLEIRLSAIPSYNKPFLIFPLIRYGDALSKRFVTVVMTACSVTADISSKPFTFFSLCPYFGECFAIQHIELFSQVAATH